MQEKGTHNRTMKKKKKTNLDTKNFDNNETNQQMKWKKIRFVKDTVLDVVFLY